MEANTGRERRAKSCLEPAEIWTWLRMTKSNLMVRKSNVKALSHVKEKNDIISVDFIRHLNLTANSFEGNSLGLKEKEPSEVDISGRQNEGGKFRKL